MSKDNKKVASPKLRLSADHHRTQLKDPDTQAALKVQFMGNGHIKGSLPQALGRLSTTYHSLPIGDRSQDEKDFFYSLCEPAFTYYDEIYNELRKGHSPSLTTYVNAQTAIAEAERSMVVWQQVKGIFAESAGLTDNNFIEVIAKARKQINDMTKGRRSPKTNDLKTAMEEIIKRHNKEGSSPTWRQVLHDLEWFHSTVVQEIDYEDKQVFWKTKKGIERKTSFKQIQNRLTGIKKKIQNN